MRCGFRDHAAIVYFVRYCIVSSRHWRKPRLVSDDRPCRGLPILARHRRLSGPVDVSYRRLKSLMPLHCDLNSLGHRSELIGSGCDCAGTYRVHYHIRFVAGNLDRM